MSDGRPPVYFVRHGETDWNRQGLIQGWIETSLNQNGHAQAQALGRALAAVPELSGGCRHFVSPLERARQTMDHIGDALSLPPSRVCIDAALTELGFGIWEGKPFWELKASPVYPADFEGRYLWRPTGGESYDDGRIRVNAWFDGLSDPALVVAHGAIGRCLIGALTGLGPAEIVRLHMPQGKYCRIHGGKAEWFDAMAVAA